MHSPETAKHILIQNGWLYEEGGFLLAVQKYQEQAELMGMLNGVKVVATSVGITIETMGFVTWEDWVNQPLVAKNVIRAAHGLPMTLE